MWSAARANGRFSLTDLLLLLALPKRKAPRSSQSHTPHLPLSTLSLNRTRSSLPSSQPDAGATARQENSTYAFTMKSFTAFAAFAVSEDHFFLKEHQSECVFVDRSRGLCFRPRHQSSLPRIILSPSLVGKTIFSGSARVVCIEKDVGVSQQRLFFGYGTYAYV